MSRQHWGEIKEENEDKEKQNKYVPDVMPDIERSMNNFSLNEFEDDYPAKNENIILAPMDPLMLYGISLHKYANDMIEMIRVAELATEVNLIPPEDAAPPIPPTPELKVTHQRNNLNYIEKEYTPFSRGEDVESPDLSETVVKQILQKCIVTIFAHVGFETTHKSVLDVLTDVLEEFLKKICLNLKNAAEDEETHGTTFPHAIERVLTQMGLGGVYGINDFYQCRVIKYIDVLRKRCIDLNDHYATLLVPQSPPSIDKLSKVVRVKVEEDDDVMEVENPELHFTAIDGECSTLESGYQLLNSLEAVSNLQSLADTEEDLSSSSPGVVPILSESEMAQLPFSKKKRFK